MPRSFNPLLADWRMPEGGPYFATPTVRARPAKVSALMDAPWSAEVVMGWKPPGQREKQSRLRERASSP
jgi:hypothetical protein